MRINSAMIHRDMTEKIIINTAGPMINNICGRVLELLTTTEVPDYNTIAGFDNWLIVQYWRKIDAMPTDQTQINFLLHKATKSDLIIRARQWLVEKNYLFPKPSVAERAHQASLGWHK